MASEPICLQWIEIERFRGFQDRQRIDLDASAVIVTGSNGTGKTSFADAVQWLLVGSIERLEAWRVRKNAEHIVSHYRIGEQADVSAGLVIGDEHIELRRVGDHRASHLEWRAGADILREDKAEDALFRALAPRGQSSLRRALLSSGLLQQDVIRDVLEEKPAERYEQLAAMLGLDPIANFPSAARRRAERVATDGKGGRSALEDVEQRLRARREDLVQLETKASQVPDVASLRRLLSKRLEQHSASVRLVGDLPLTVADAQGLRATTGRLGERLASLGNEHDPDADRLASEEAPSEAAVEGAEAAAKAATQAVGLALEALASAEAAHAEAARIADQFARLAAEALPLLGPTCPVCRQDIEPEEITRHLREILDRDGSDLATLAETRGEAENTLAQARAGEAAATEQWREILRRQQQIESARQRHSRWLEQLTNAISEADARVAFVESDAIGSGDTAALARTVEGLREMWRVTGELGSALSSVDEVAAVSSARSEIVELEASVADARKRAAEVSAIEDEAKALQRAAVRAINRVTETRFSVLAPMIQDVYSRLDPHPAFTNLRFSVDVYRERSIASPTVEDPDQELEADPLLIFSSSQANIVALSAFLSLGWAAGANAMPFLLLDDPLQSLDDVNALGFADLCRHIRGQRQLIVSTHDERLASLLERKLAPRRDEQTTRLVRFVAWSRTGPEIEASVVLPQTSEGVRRAVVQADAA